MSVFPIEITEEGGGSLQESLQDYFRIWEQFADSTALDSLYRRARPIAVGYKVESERRFYELLESMVATQDQVHVATVDDRKIAAIVCAPVAPDGISILKLMMRRPGSRDPAGLDHVDFLYSDTRVDFTAIEEAGGRAEWEENASHRWLSVRFGEAYRHEAKLIDHTVLGIAANQLIKAEMAITNPQE